MILLDFIIESFKGNIYRRGCPPLSIGNGDLVGIFGNHEVIHNTSHGKPTKNKAIRFNVVLEEKQLVQQLVLTGYIPHVMFFISGLIVGQYMICHMIYHDLSVSNTPFSPEET